MKKIIFATLLIITACSQDDDNNKVVGAVDGVTFDTSITCITPLGSKALPAFFSFRSSRDTENGDKHIKISGGTFEENRLIFSITKNDFQRNIISSSYVVKNGILKDSGAIKNELNNTSYQYNFTIRCK